jgi:methanogenic corrinoid protein MtbC1
LRSHNFESAVTHILFPFLERIGVLWMTSHINPSHEHLVSNIIRQKLIVGIENLPFPTHSSKLVVLFLPENEHHELGLLYAYYLMKLKGIKVIYLGATVPLKDLEYIVKRTNPTFAYSHVTSLPTHFNVDKYIQNLHTRLPETRIVLSGHIAEHYKKQLPANISLKKSLGEVNEFLASL